MAQDDFHACSAGEVLQALEVDPGQGLSETDRLTAVETLGATHLICTDKTGTLTENRMTLTRVITDEEENRNETLDNGIRGFGHHDDLRHGAEYGRLHGRFRRQLPRDCFRFTGGLRSLFE